jgi:hypothetical protein
MKVQLRNSLLFIILLIINNGMRSICVQFLSILRYINYYMFKNNKIKLCTCQTTPILTNVLILLRFIYNNCICSAVLFFEKCCNFLNYFFVFFLQRDPSGKFFSSKGVFQTKNLQQNFSKNENEQFIFLVYREFSKVILEKREKISILDIFALFFLEKCEFQKSCREICEYYSISSIYFCLVFMK